MDGYGFLKVAAAVPRVEVADCDFNIEQILALAEQAAQRGVEIVAFPELALTAATCGDLLLQPILLEAAEEALLRLVRKSRKLPLVLIVGAPLRHRAAIYNCAVVFSQGKILGVVPKSYLADYSAGSERRIFSSGAEITEEEIAIGDATYDFGSDLSFEVNGVEFGIELGEEPWIPNLPSLQRALDGAKVIFALAATPEQAGTYHRLRERITQLSAQTIAGYVYCSAGFGESSTDLVYAGKAFIAENGQLLAQDRGFALDGTLTVADIDVERLDFVRRRTTAFRTNDSGSENMVIEMQIPEPMHTDRLDRRFSSFPFLPQPTDDAAAFYNEVLEIQSHGLAKRLLHTKCQRAIIGISGGLDSTLALLAVVRTFDKLGYDRRNILGITMPGFGTTDRTYHNALELMELLGITVREISIRKACEQHFQDIDLASTDRSAAYENGQARERTQILMDVANKENGLVIGTGDLSELALGWATFNGDQMSMYGINASIPKTLVRALVEWAATTYTDSPRIGEILHDVVATPVSPELLPADAAGHISQKTEDLVGPYELHDFFLYHFIEGGYEPRKLLHVAANTFRDSHDRTTIRHWLEVFFRRFFSQQFKRSSMPDGPKVGPISLSPRGDWRMPSDASAKIWLNELQTLE